MLLARKDYAAYREMLRVLKELEPALAPRTMMMDMEAAAIKAYREAWPGLDISTCYFHLANAVITWTRNK